MEVCYVQPTRMRVSYTLRLRAQTSAGLAGRNKVISLSQNG